MSHAFRARASLLVRLATVLTSVALAACESTPAPAFTPFPFGAPLDAESDRLCAGADAPDQLPDPRHPDCALEGERLTTQTPAPTRSLRLLAYNLERGYALDAQLAWLASGAAPEVDVVLLSEADRGCARTGGRHVAREWANALAMDYVFAVEFEEVSFDAAGAITEVCEHGNAILSRHPLGNVRAIRFAATDDWTTPPASRTYPTSTRFGGRVAIGADVDVGRGRRFRIYGGHLASGAVENELRGAEIRELIEDAAAQPWPTVIGGDLNTHFYEFDLDLDADTELVTQALLTAGYIDSHASLATDVRATDQEYGLIIDLLFGRGVTFAAPWIADAAVVGALSDHLPIGATVSF